MKTTKMIRYTGLGLMMISVVILLYLSSFSLFKDKKAKSEDQYAVLEISEGIHVFPKTGFDALFSNMDMASDSLQIDVNSSSQEQQTKMDTAILGTHSNHVILFAVKGAGTLALNAALSNKSVAAVILLCPTLDANADANAFGTQLPDIPVAIIDAKTEYSTALYERLSGEDATLLPGHTDSGYPGSTVYISPDTSRYLCQWSFPCQSDAGRSALLFFPQNQIKTGEFISTYVLGDDASSDTGIRASVVRVQILTLMAVAFLASGILLFFASIPKKRRESINGAYDLNSSEKDTIGPAKGITGNKVFFAALLLATLFSAGVVLLYSVSFLHAADVLSSWPVFYYAVFAALFFRKLPKIKSTTRIAYMRIIFSCFVAFLFAVGTILTVAMNTASFSMMMAGGRGIWLFFVDILLAVFAWAWMSADELSVHDKQNGNVRTGWSAKWYQPASLLLPYALVCIFSLVSGRNAGIMRCLVLLAALALATWTRYVFRRMSGTKWLAAVMFSIIYSLIAFG